MLEKVVSLDACTLLKNDYFCKTTISDLTNDALYVFKVSVISLNKVESPLSAEKSIIPTDKTPPVIPGNINVDISTSSTLFKWTGVDGAAFYRLYHGIKSGAYGESFDSLPGTAELVFSSNQFDFKNDYFAVSALDNYKNESAKSAEIFCSDGQCD